MSTRSGKRIHGSFHESTDKVDTELVVKSEKKTITKCLKENIQELGVTLFKSKKRNNYVSYPTDDERLEAGDKSVTNEIKHTRSTRKNALKEQNIEIPATENLVTSNSTIKVGKVTRKTKKLAESFAENGENYENPDKQEPVEVKKVKAKKNKKKKDLHVEEVNNVTESEPIKKKFKRKKGRKSNSLISDIIVNEEENLAKNLNNTNMSTDSFHSASESPLPNGICKSKTRAKISKDIHSESVISDNRRTKTPDKYTKQEFSGVKDKNSTYDHDKSLSESSDSFVFRKGSDINNDLKKQKSCIENSVLVEDVSVKETSSSSKKRKSSITSTTHDNEIVAINSEHLEFNNILIIHSTIDKNEPSQKKINTTFDKEDNSTLHSPDIIRKSIIINTTFEKDAKESPKSPESLNRKKPPIQNILFKQNTIKSISPKLNVTFDKNSISPKMNSTFEMENKKSSIHSPVVRRKSTVINTTFESETKITPKTSESNKKNENLTQITINREDKNATFNNSPTLNTTFELETSKKSSTNHKSSLDKSITKSFNATFDRVPKINTTFENNSKSSLISSDRSNDEDISRVTITSDDSSINLDSDKISDDGSSNEINDDFTMNVDLNKIPNDDPSKEVIMNTTPFLIESSMDETLPNLDKTLGEESVLTPLKREGTFTKDGPDVIPGPASPAVPSPKQTPTKRMSLASPGRTPFLVRSLQKEKIPLNVTRSIEKGRRSSVAETASRITKVMFCSPVNDPAVVTHQKRKIIKSNLKGSNKSFVFEDSDFTTRAGPRKRSYTQSDADDARAKRKRLADDMQQSVDRLSRPRTSSASAKLTESTTPTKKDSTPAKVKSDGKVTRKRLPNFAVLHQREFDKMESLDECQDRRAKRARQLLTPPAVGKNMLKESSTEVMKDTQKTQKEAPKKPDFTAKPPIIDPQKVAYTRFGYKLNLDVNPFSIPSKEPVPEVAEKVANGLARQATMPSMAGTTSVRREAAKQVVMREKSFTDRRSVKRHEHRSIIKGVRTNRRFELQMKLRNIE